MDKRRTVMETFMEFQFNFCSLVWIFHWRITNYKLISLHQRAFLMKMVFLIKATFSIHEKNCLFNSRKKLFIQSLAIEIFKFLKGLSQKFRNNLFPKIFSKPHVFRNRQEILRQLDTELKPYRIGHLKFRAKFLKLSK